MVFMVKRHIAIILARGGSKRLPRKNILDFHGKPMLAWSIEAALESRQFDRVLVSTDDEEIAQVGLNYGAEVPFLRDSAVDDVSPSSQATLGALKQAELFWGEEYDSVSQLMANCPLRDKKDILDLILNFEHFKVNSQISCFRFGWMNPWWALKLSSEGIPDYLFPETRILRSQDLPPLYCPSGAMWISRTDYLKAEKTFYSVGHIYFPLDWISAMDIDDAEDMAMAKACFLVKLQKQQTEKS